MTEDLNCKRFSCDNFHNFIKYHGRCEDLVSPSTEQNKDEVLDNSAWFQETYRKESHKMLSTNYTAWEP